IRCRRLGSGILVIIVPMRVFLPRQIEQCPGADPARRRLMKLLPLLLSGVVIMLDGLRRPFVEGLEALLGPPGRPPHGHRDLVPVIPFEIGILNYRQGSAYALDRWRLQFLVGGMVTVVDGTVGLRERLLERVPERKEKLGRLG